MRSAISLLLLAPALMAAGPSPFFAVLSENSGPWPAILGSIGFQQKPTTQARVFVMRGGAAASPEWGLRVENGAILILEGESSMAEWFGFRRGKDSVRVASLTDIHNPKLPIVWERALELPLYEVEAGAQVFARERWTGAPMLAGVRRGGGAVLWMAVPPGSRGYERFPYLLQALCDLGMDVPFRSARLWAFFDYSYRLRVDLAHFAERWRQAGISSLHVAAWHFFEPDSERDAYLAKLITDCHRNGVLVYAWLELPHVSERFWGEHPEWREQTALGQDAHLDWRKLMNLANRECFRAVSSGVRQLVRRFDWDGINVAELYFESLEGMSNPARFTPMNSDVRRQFQALRGFDPLELFRGRSDARRAFLDFRADLAHSMQEEWLGEVEQMRRERPDLDLVLTHVDDRFDTGMREAIGADAARALPLLDRYRFTFLIEDPATVWHLGPQRYGEIARQYRALTTKPRQLGVDLNIVERYQNVYPTKQQTGVEFLQLVHSAADAFANVALYFENSIQPPDLRLLPAAAAAVARVERLGGKLVVDSRESVGVNWRGPALVDGRPWPVAGNEVVWLGRGTHTVEAGGESARPRVVDFTGDLLSARYTPEGAIEISYNSAGRAFAALDRRPLSIDLDGVKTVPVLAGPATLTLPRGQHLVTIQTH